MGQQVGFGHALLETSDDATLERQPCSLDGAVWITGDVRVDQRADFVRALNAAGRAPPKVATDPELVLHGYQAWGEALVDRLRGDFSFVIWDGVDRRLFGARDQLGVKPFFYARLGTQLILSNTLSCLRAHGSMPDKLNDAAIGDFLLFGFNCDAKTTTFEAIQRLPGGHTLSWSAGQEPHLARYWTLPVYDELRLQRPTDYVERFRSLLAGATSDRIRTDCVGIHMSGGLDSSLIAATALGLLVKRGAPFELRAHTVVYDKLFSDEERYFSGVVAESLDIPIQYLDADNYGLFDGGSSSRFQFPEPLSGLSRPSFFSAFNRQMAAKFRVALTGLDGDALLTASWPSHLARLARDRKFDSLAVDVLRYAGAKQDLFGALAHRLPWRPRGGLPEPTFPTWLEPAFEQRLKLKDRWVSMAAKQNWGQGSREGAYRAMSLQTWLPILESYDAGVTGVAVDRRHPLLDLRIVEFGLSLPAIPWCVDKHILRASAQNLLPKSIRKRPKSPLGGDPLPFVIRDYLARVGEDLAFHTALGKYVDVGQMPRILDETKSEVYWLSLRVLILNYWLFNLEGERNGRRETR